jgi:hypothetical protein
MISLSLRTKFMLGTALLIVLVGGALGLLVSPTEPNRNFWPT